MRRARAQQKRHRQVGRGVGQDVGRVGDDDPARGRRGPVDLVHAHGVARDDLEAVGGLDHRAGDGVVDEADQRVDARDLGGELELGRS